ncbi:MAG: hypothetical protein GW949_06360 [Spirochaetales bacterium]|nr:hypothetical protein [Spirochaetales bacterium]
MVRTFSAQGQSTDPLRWPSVSPGTGQREGVRSTKTYARYQDTESGKLYEDSPQGEL